MANLSRSTLFTNRESNTPRKPISRNVNLLVSDWFANRESANVEKWQIIAAS